MSYTVVLEGLFFEHQLLYRNFLSYYIINFIGSIRFPANTGLKTEPLGAKFPLFYSTVQKIISTYPKIHYDLHTFTVCWDYF